MEKNNTTEWSNVRKDFPGLEKQTYLNAAGMSPLPGPVHEAGASVLKLMSDDVAGFAENVLPLNIKSHYAVAGFYNADVNDIALVNTTSMGMNMVALHFRNIQPNKTEVVVLADEFPSSTIPWEKQGYTLKYINPEKDGRYEANRILAEVSQNTAAVVASYVQYNTGSRLDVFALAQALKEKNVHFVLNATQAAGIIPIDLSELPVSAMVTSGNKWIMAGIGGAVLYLPEHIRGQQFPPLAGWLSADPISFNNKPENLNKGAASLEVGLNSLVPVVCVAAAVEYLQSIGVAKIEQRVLSLADLLINGLLESKAEVLTPVNREDRAGIVSVRRKDAPEWVSRLKANDIHVVLRGPDDVRISPHIYNDEKDIIALLESW